VGNSLFSGYYTRPFWRAKFESAELSLAASVGMDWDALKRKFLSLRPCSHLFVDARSILFLTLIKRNYYFGYIASDNLYILHMKILIKNYIKHS
jgi:hypothetical protein